MRAAGQKDLITVVGRIATITAGEFIQASGTWVNDRTHGQQFRAAFLKTSAPSLEGIERYLASGLIRGIGPIYAKRLVRAFGSRVITNAHRINRGEMPDLRRTTELSDFYFIDAADPDDAVARIVAAVRDRIPRAFGLDPIRDTQVLCPMNRGGLGARSLNIELQKALNPPGEIAVERFGWTFCPGDKVMQVENNYDRDVYNGDLGIVRSIDLEQSELTVDFDGREVSYEFGELDELVLAYATTITKVRDRNIRRWLSR